MQILKAKKYISPEVRATNPIIKMIEDKKRIVEAIKAGKNLSTLEGIKFVTPL